VKKYLAQTAGENGGQKPLSLGKSLQKNYNISTNPQEWAETKRPEENCPGSEKNRLARCGAGRGAKSGNGGGETVVSGKKVVMTRKEIKAPRVGGEGLQEISRTKPREARLVKRNTIHNTNLGIPQEGGEGEGKEGRAAVV